MGTGAEQGGFRGCLWQNYDCTSIPQLLGCPQDQEGTDKAPIINVCSSLPAQIPEGASLAMSLTDKKDTTLSRGNRSLLFPAADD